MVRLQFALVQNMMMVAKGKKKKKFSFLPYYLESRYLLGSRGRTGITKELTEAKDRGKSDVIKHARKSAEQMITSI